MQSDLMSSEMSTLVRIITATDEEIRNRSLEGFARRASAETLLRECAALDRLRRENENLYEQVRALFFLYSGFICPARRELPPGA